MEDKILLVQVTVLFLYNHFNPIFIIRRLKCTINVQDFIAIKTSDRAEQLTQIDVFKRFLESYYVIHSKPQPMQLIQRV